MVKGTTIDIYLLNTFNTHNFIFIIRFYLRLLLVNVPGSTSFEDLRTINGVLCPTFKQACVELHLVQDDNEWIHAFNEAQLFSSGTSLRNLFVVALTFANLSLPVDLWETFCYSICDDLEHHLQQLFPDNPFYLTDNTESFYNGSPILDYGLYLIDNKLKQQGSALSNYPMPPYEHNWSEALMSSTLTLESANDFINEQRSYDFNSETNTYQSRYALFNEDQRTAFDRIVEQIESGNSINRCFFLHGPAGTGKTFVYNTIANYFRGSNQIVLCVASSGIAALLLTGGRTSHSRFKIPLSIDEGSTCYIERGKPLAELIMETTLIIWDEVPMQHRYCFEAVDRTLRDIRQDDSLFGGIPVILGGDFAQIAPVIRHGDRTAIVAASIRQSFIWHHTEVIHLRVNMRIRGVSENDTHYKDWLYRITYSQEYQNSAIPLPPYIYNTTVLNDLISRVYPRRLLLNAIHRPDLLSKTAILTTRNNTVDELNAIILNRMPGNSLNLLSSDVAEYDNADGNELFQVTTEYMQTLNPNNFPPTRLSLKVGCVVMLLRNFNAPAGLCNGTRLIIKEIGSFVLKVAVLKNDDEAEEQIELIPRITLQSLDGEYPFILKRTQFPVKLSYAMTINKSQGQSLENVGIDLRHSAFTHGQLYVALSRSTNVDNISVLHNEESLSNTVENVVYPELLQ